MSIGLSAAELTAIRDDIADLMPDTCTIQQVAYANDAIGQPARSFSNRATGVSCRLDPDGGITYEVVHVDDDKSWQASVRCVLKTITPSN
jgi:hypothetical protein